MHEQKTLAVRNPGRPTMERLPCRLTRDEKIAADERRYAVERTIEQLNAEMEAIRAQKKAELDELAQKKAELEKEARSIREQRLDGFEERLVECELLEDLPAKSIYVLRLDLMEVAQRRDMAPHEQRELSLDGRTMRTVDIPEDVAEVTRFDSDPPGVVVEEAEPANGSSYGHEHEYNEGACIVCGEVDPDYDAPAKASTPRRRRKGSGKGYDARAAAGH